MGGEIETEIERVDRGSMIATINMSGAGLLARVTYYEFRAVRDGMHRELMVLQKLPSLCRAELLRVTSPQTPQSPLHVEQMEGGREGGRDGGRDGEREGVREGGRERWRVSGEREGVERDI